MPELPVGQTFAGRYEIVRLLGQGAMGSVYQAKQLGMDRMVALKVIRTDVVETPLAAKRFEQEMRFSARVEHPNTIRVYDFGEHAGQLYLAMEFLVGRSLAALIEAQGRLELPRIVRIAKQMAHALGAAHEMGVVHRDLKPENVMLIENIGEPDFVKVLDFGIAKSLDESNVKVTATGSMVGTPAYMSPEQALGRPVDARSDLYALGIVLYQMVCGKVPFDRPTIGSMILAHATDPPPPLVGEVPDAPPLLSALVMQLLEKDPAARPQSALEVAARLDECSRGGPARARKRRAPWLLAAGALVVVGGGVAAALAFGGAGGAAARGPDAAARVLVAPDAAGCGEGERLVQRARDELKTDGNAALATADQALKLCPELGDAHNVRGNALQKLGRLDEAESAYLRALSTNPAADAPRFNLGLLQLRRKDASAVTTFTELLRRHPDNAEAHVARAQAYLETGRAEEALADFEEAVSLQPSHEDWWLALAELRERLKHGDANEAYCKAKALGAKDIRVVCK